MSSDAAILVGKGADEDETLRGNDFAISKLAPHFVAVRRAEAVVKGAAGPEFHFGGGHGEALRGKPFHQTLALGPRFPNELARSIEGARDDKWALESRRIFKSVHNVSRIWFLGHKNHPANPEAVSDHAEARGKEC